MKTIHSVASILAILGVTLALAGEPSDKAMENYPARYMGGDADIITAPNGALIYGKALESIAKIAYTEPVIEDLGNGIWVIGGYSIANFVVIDAPDGLVVETNGGQT